MSWIALTASLPASGATFALARIEVDTGMVPAVSTATVFNGIYKLAYDAADSGFDFQELDDAPAVFAEAPTHYFIVPDPLDA